MPVDFFEKKGAKVENTPPPSLSSPISFLIFIRNIVPTQTRTVRIRFGIIQNNLQQRLEITYHGGRVFLCGTLRTKKWRMYFFFAGILDLNP